MKKYADHWRGDLAATSFLLLATVLFFWNVLLGPRVLLPADVLYRVPPWSALPEAAQHVIPHNALIADAILQNIAWKSFARSAIMNGELPLWNPYEFAGMPFLAGGQSGSIYPLGVLFYLLPVEQAYGPFLALHLLIAGLSAYFFARVLGARPAAALVGGITFAYCAFLIVSFTWPMIVSAAVWLPLLLAIVELIVRGVENGRRPAVLALFAILGGFVLGMEILAGHLEITLYTAFSLLFYGMGRLISGPLRARQWKSAALAFSLLAGFGLLGPAIAAVQLLPFYELITQNFRAGFVDIKTVLSYALPPWQVATFVLPDFFGNPSHHSYYSLAHRAWQSVGPNALGQPTDPPQTIWWGWPKNYVEAASYLGILPLFAASVGAIGWRSRQTTVLALLAIWSLALAFGSPVYALLFLGIPGVDQLHTPFRWIFPFSIAIAILCALGLEHLARRTPPWLSRVWWILAVFGGLGLVASAVIAILPGPAIDIANDLLIRSSRLQRSFSDGNMLLSYELKNVAVFSALCALTGTALFLIGRRPRRGLALAVLIVTTDLFVAHVGFNARTDPAPIHAEPPAIVALRADPEPFRIVGMIDGDPLSPITSMLARLEDVRGYDTVIPKRFVEYWSLIEPPVGLEYSKLQGIERTESLASPFLRLLNVRYVVAARPIQTNAADLIHSGDLEIYRLRDPIARAFIVGKSIAAADDKSALNLMRSPHFDPRATVILSGEQGTADNPDIRGTVRTVERTPNRLRYEVTSDGSGYFVISDFYFHGWRARVNGADTPIIRANYIFRAVPITSGTHSIELQYAPDSVRIGGAISGLAILTALFLSAIAGWRAMNRSTFEDSPFMRIARNAFSGMGTQLVNKVIDFGFAIMVLHVLQAAGVGRYAFAIVIAGYLEIASNFGLNALVVRDAAQRPGDLERIGGSSLLLRMALWALGMPIVIVFLLVWRQAFNLADETVIATLLLCFSVALGNVAATYSALFYARERVVVPSLLTVVTTLIKVALGVLALLTGFGIVGLAIVSIAGNAITAIVLWFLAVKLGICKRLSMSTLEARAMIRPAFPLMLNHLLATVFFRIDILFLQPMRGDREVGYYATAYKFVDGLGIIPSAFTFAIFPVLSRLATASPDSLRRAYATSLKMLVFISIPLALAFTAAAYPLVTAVGGPSYLPDSAIALQLLIWFLPLSFANGLTQYALVAAGQQSNITRAFVIAVAFNITANAIAIPQYGYRAAAVITVLSEVVLMIPFAFAISRTLGLSIIRTIGPILIAGSFALITYLVVEPTSNGLIGATVALSVYLMVVIAWKPLDSGEREALNNWLRRYGRQWYTR